MLKRENKIQGVVIKGYHTNNVIFKKSEFVEKILRNQENIKSSGSGASHQDLAKEHAIKMLVTMKRTMLMYAALIFP